MDDTNDLAEPWTLGEPVYILLGEVPFRAVVMTDRIGPLKMGYASALKSDGGVDAEGAEGVEWVMLMEKVGEPQKIDPNQVSATAWFAKGQIVSAMWDGGEHPDGPRTMRLCDPITGEIRT